MGVNNCDDFNIIKEYIKDKNSFIEDSASFVNLLQSFINSLNCNVKQIVCLKSSAPCDNTKLSFCEFYIKGLERELDETYLTVSAILSNNTNTPYSYSWSFDTTILRLVTGTNTTSSTLQLEWIGATVDNTLIHLEVIDGNGCSDTIDFLLDTCIPCDDKSFTIDPLTLNVCKPENIVLIDGFEYYEEEITCNIACGLDTNYGNKVVETRLEINGITTNYNNGFIKVGNVYKFRIKKSDISLLTTNSFTFHIVLEDCSRVELSYIFQPNTIPCCTECLIPVADITVLSTCTNTVIKDNKEYYQTTLLVTLACGSVNMVNYIESLELLMSINTDYIIEPIPGFAGRYNLFIDAVDYNNFCNEAPIGNISLQGSNTYPIGSLINGRNYIQQYTSHIISNESYDSVLDIYWFDLPNKEGFDLTVLDKFCGDNLLGTNEWELRDTTGRIAYIYSDNAFLQNIRHNIFGGSIEFFGDNSFLDSTGNNLFLESASFINNAFSLSSGDNTIYLGATFGDEAFKDSIGNNIITGDIGFGVNAFKNANPTVKNSIGNIIVCGSDFGDAYIGILDLIGLIGTNSNLPEFSNFMINSSATLNVKSNLDPLILGYTEGDLDVAITNGCTVNYIL